MHGSIQTLLKILDGSPRPARGFQQGQSLVELLLITPLMIIMFAGIVEIGWYANHVLIMLEVTRVGARQATLYTGEFAFQAWNSNASIAPISYTLQQGFDTPNANFDDYKGMGLVDDDASGTVKIQASNFRNCDPNTLNQNRGFYNSVACAMINSLSPLTIKGRAPGTADILGRRIRLDFNATTPLVGREWEDGRLWFTYQPNEMFVFPDDIVISVFSFQAINNLKGAGSATPDPRNVFLADPANQDVTTYTRSWDFGNRYPRGYQVVVAGRYPINANECNVTYEPLNTPADSTVPHILFPGESFLKRAMVLGAVSTDYEARLWDSGRNAMQAPRLYSGPTAGSTQVGTFRWVDADNSDPATWAFRDPFDYYFIDHSRNSDPNDPNRFFELPGMDEQPEFQRGFVWTGQNLVDDQLNVATGLQLFCVGSEWSDQDVQELMNTPAFLQRGLTMPPQGDPDLADAAWRAANMGSDPGPSGPVERPYTAWQSRARFLPSQGMVLVEMFWRHDVLLDFPLMTPIFRLMEASGGPYNIVISAWAAFPLPSAEPNITFGLPTR